MPVDLEIESQLTNQDITSGAVYASFQNTARSQTIWLASELRISGMDGNAANITAGLRLFASNGTTVIGDFITTAPKFTAADTVYTKVAEKIRVEDDEIVKWYIESDNASDTVVEIDIVWLDPTVADAVQISGDDVAADNLEVLYDGVEGFTGAYAGPRGPGVYYNDAAGNANTVNGTDGTWNNPVSTIGAAKTIADSLSVDRIYLVGNSDATLIATMEDYEFVGIGEMTANTITFGSQDVDRSVFYNLLLTGAQGGTGRCQAVGCCLSSITGMEITALWSLIANAGSLTLRDDCAFAFCFSAVAGGDTPTLDINSVANVNVYFRHYSGGLTVDNAVATTVMSYESDGQFIVDATCTSLTAVVRGNCSITDNGTTTNLTQDAAINRTGINAEVVDVIRTDTPAELAAVPAANAPLHEQMQWLFQKTRNKETTTATTATISKDDDTTIGTSTLSDDNTTFTKGKYS